MPQVFVTLIGSQVAVANNKEEASRQLVEISIQNADDMIEQVMHQGEVNKTIRARVCYVTVNQ